ncbi:MAG: dihydropteroate synthase [Oxalobacteraceae bacterium]
MENYFQCGRYRLPLQDDVRPLVMGILNATPDSFSDGGQYHALESALSRAEQMIAEGVDIIDIGGETTRPGAKMLPLENELQRVMPLVYALRDCGKPLSIDTYKPQVMREVLAAGADMINDINGFRAEGAVDAVKDSDCGLCVMHMQNQPQNMQSNPQYTNTVDEVICFLRERVKTLQAAGIFRSRLCIDPGFGFGKTLPDNLVLLKNLDAMQTALDLPLLVGMSRKSMVGAITGQPVEKRLAGSLAAALIATANGARIVRVHDVAETIDALAVWQAATR